MKTLVSVFVRGLVPIPPAETPTGAHDDPRRAGDNRDLSRLSFLYRPIVKRMATKEELARIREELQEIPDKQAV